MQRKWIIWLIIPVMILLSGYIYTRWKLSGKIRKEEEKTHVVVKPVDSLGGKKLSALDLRPLFIERLQQLVNKTTNNLYDLTVGDLKVDLLTSHLSLSNVRLIPVKSRVENKSLPDNIITLYFQTLDIEGVNLDDVITRQTMDYKTVRLVHPVIEIEHRQNKGEKEDQHFALDFLKQMKWLTVNHLVVEDGTIIIKKANNQQNRLNNVSITMNDIRIDSATRKDTDRFLFARSAFIRLKDYHTQTKDGLYHFRVGQLSIKAPEDMVQLENISFRSPYNKIEFTQKQKKAKEWYQFNVPKAKLEKVNWWRLLNEEEIVAQTATLEGGKLAVYFDRSLPPISRLGNFPNQLLLKMPLHLSIEKLRWNNLDVSYEEVNPITKKTGLVYFDNVVASVTHLQNVNQSQPMEVHSTALFMHQVPIKASFQFNMSKSSQGAFSAGISADKPFSASLINSFSEPLGMTRIERGQLQTVRANIKGNQYEASGQARVLYNDLKLTLLEKNKKDNGLNKKHITSLFANAFVLKKENPKPGEEPGLEPASFKRDPEGGFFMLVWKTMLVGILKTIGAPEKIASKKPKP